MMEYIQTFLLMAIVFILYTDKWDGLAGGLAVLSCVVWAVLVYISSNRKA